MSFCYHAMFFSYDGDSACEIIFVTISTGHTHLIFELLTELQGNGEKHQSVIQPRHYTLHLMDVAHLKLGVVVFTWEENKIIWNDTKPSSNRLFKKKKKRAEWHIMILYETDFRCCSMKTGNVMMITYNIAPGLCSTELPAGLKF